ncbi:trichohyalin-like [Drosophila montana]|uniref:trichohyalin-like n=1 Tax=Drosophila montana TaxID=40370 RepID=UPI00313D1075
MDFLDSILNAMDAPPNTGEQQKQREYMERMKNKQREELARFRSYVQERMGRFAKDGRTSIEFQPFDRIHRTIIQEAAEYGGFMAMSFGRGEDIRQSVVYKKEHPPDADELFARRKGEGWNKEIARQYAERRKDRSKQEQEKSEKQASAAATAAIPADALTPAIAPALATAAPPESSTINRMQATFKSSGSTPSARDHIANSNPANKPVVSYRAKYAHLIAEPSTLQSVRETSTNHSYGFVPSRFKRDNRSIEQTLADIQARKRLRMQQEQEQQLGRQQLVQGRQRKMQELSKKQQDTKLGLVKELAFRKDPSRESEDLKLEQQPVLEFKKRSPEEQQKLVKKRKVEVPRIEELLALSDDSSEEEQLEQQKLVNRKVDDKVPVVKEYGSNEDYLEKRQEIIYPDLKQEKEYGMSVDSSEEEQFEHQHPSEKRQEIIGLQEIKELGLSEDSSEKQLQQQKLIKKQTVEELPKEFVFGKDSSKEQLKLVKQKVEKVPRTKDLGNSLEKQQKRKKKKLDKVPRVKEHALGTDSSEEQLKKRKVENAAEVSNSSDKHYPDSEETSRLPLSKDSLAEEQIDQQNRGKRQEINCLGLNRVKELVLSEDSSEEEPGKLTEEKQLVLIKGPSKLHKKRKRQIVKKVPRVKEFALGNNSSEKQQKVVGEMPPVKKLVPSEDSSEEELLETQKLEEQDQVKELALSEDSADQQIALQNLTEKRQEIMDLGQINELKLSVDLSKKQLKQQKQAKRMVHRVARIKELELSKESSEKQLKHQKLQEINYPDLRQDRTVLSEESSEEEQQNLVEKRRNINYLDLKKGKDLALSKDSSEDSSDSSEEKQLAWSEDSENEQNETQTLVENRQIEKLALGGDSKNIEQQKLVKKQEVEKAHRIKEVAPIKDSTEEQFKLVKNQDIMEDAQIKELARSEDSSEEEMEPKLERREIKYPVLKQVEELALSEDSSEEEHLESKKLVHRKREKLALGEDSSLESDEENLQVQNLEKWMVGPAGGSELELSEESSLESE